MADHILTAVISNENNEREIRRLRQSGHEIVPVPGPEFEPRKLSGSDLEKLRSPGDFDWAVFCDERAVELLSEASEEHAFELARFEDPTVVAIGEAAADRLRFLELHSDVIPTRLDPGSVFEAIAGYAGGKGYLEGVSVLAVASAVTARFPAKALQEAGSVVEIIAMADCRLNDPGSLPKTKALAVGGGFDAVYFGSARDVFDAELLAERFGVDLLWGEARALCGDDRTRASLAEMGIDAARI